MKKKKTISPQCSVAQIHDSLLLTSNWTTMFRLFIIFFLSLIIIMRIAYVLHMVEQKKAWWILSGLLKSPELQVILCSLFWYQNLISFHLKKKLLNCRFLIEFFLFYNYFIHINFVRFMLQTHSIFKWQISGSNFFFVRGIMLSTPFLINKTFTFGTSPVHSTNFRATRKSLPSFKLL